jgi:hypothetical protein
MSFLFLDDDFGMAAFRRPSSRQTGNSNKRNRAQTSAMSTFFHPFQMFDSFGGNAGG